MANLIGSDRPCGTNFTGRISVWGADVDKSRMSIKDLTPHIPNTAIIGLVIAKQSIQSFPDKKNPGLRRYKFCFSIRDSPSDYINVTVWGSELYTTKLFNSFKIDNIIQLCNCQISTKPGGEADDKWSPWTPCPFHLHMSESHSTLTICSEQDGGILSALAHVPLRPSNDYYTLSDILMNGTSLNGSLVNILFGIKSVCTPKEMVSKTGRQLKKCEVRIMDEGCDNFVLVIWESELIEMAQTWTPRQNIIFAVDLKIGYDQYRNMITATCSSKTIITCNPDCPEAHKLYQYLQSVAPEVFTEDEQQKQFDLQSVTTVYTIDQIRQLSEHRHEQEFTKSFVTEGITYALITYLDIDGDPSTCLTHKCSRCRFRVSSDSVSCCNQNCPSLHTGEFSSQLTLDISLSLSDHSGTIHFVRLSGETANDLLTTTPNEFMLMTEEQRTVLKSEILLERYKIYFKWSMFTEQKGTLRIMKASLANPSEVISQKVTNV